MPQRERLIRTRWMICLLTGLLGVVPRLSHAATQLRVTRVDGPPIVGTFGGLQEDVLLLRERNDSAERAIPLGSIASLERSTGSHGHALQGAAIGFVVGALAGSVVGGRIQPREGTGANANWAWVSQSCSAPRARCSEL